MTKLTIGGEERDLKNANAPWIRDHVRALRTRRLPVCVQVSIDSGAIDMLLSTPGCDKAATPSRRPNQEEKRIFDLWHKRGLDETDFDVGQLIAFLSEIKHI